MRGGDKEANEERRNRKMCCVWKITSRIYLSKCLIHWSNVRLTREARQKKLCGLSMWAFSLISPDFLCMILLFFVSESLHLMWERSGKLIFLMKTIFPGNFRGFFFVRKFCNAIELFIKEFLKFKINFESFTVFITLQGLPPTT